MIWFELLAQGWIDSRHTLNKSIMMPFSGPNNPELQNATNFISPDFWGHLIPFENVRTEKRVIMSRKILEFGGVLWTLLILHMHNICTISTICTMILQKTKKKEN